VSSSEKSETTYFVASPQGGEYESISRTELKKQLRDGSLRKSRLIWNPKEETWKPAQDVDSLKATGEIVPPQAEQSPADDVPPQDQKSETQLLIANPNNDGYESLPRSEIKRQLRDGRLRKSRLVWNQTEESWKPTTETPGLKITKDISEEVQPAQEASQPPAKSETSLVVASKDRQTYGPVPRSEIQRSLQDGSLSQSQLIWVPTDGIWRAAREVPGLGNSPQQTAPKAVVVPVATRSSATIKGGAKQPVQASGATRRSGVAPAPMLAGVGTRASSQNTRRSGVMVETKTEGEHAPKIETRYDEERKWKIYKGAQIFYGVLVVALIIGALCYNSVMVEKPLLNALNASEFSRTVKLKGHYGNYFDPRAIVVSFEELPKGMPPERFVDLLTVLAQGTRKKTFAGSVELEKDGKLLYVLPGQAWRELADQASIPTKQRSDKIIYNLYTPDGRPVYNSKTDQLSTQNIEKAKVLTVFTEAYAGKSTAPVEKTDESEKKEESKEESKAEEKSAEPKAEAQPPSDE
jgi:hypothetical protein